MTYHHIRFSQPLHHHLMRPEIPFVHFDVEVPFQAPHGPSTLDLAELQAGTVPRYGQELKAVAKDTT